MTRPAWGCVVGLIGAAVGGTAGFAIRGVLNSGEVIGFGNIPEQLVKLLIWSVVGAVLGATVARAIARATTGRGNDKPSPGGEG